MRGIFRRTEINPCNECGASDWIYPSFWSRARYWLTFGGPWGSGPRTCGRCGHRIEWGGGFGWSSYSSHRLPAIVRVLLAPMWAVVALQRARVAHPVPWIYVAAAAIGLPLGVLLDRTIGIPWWLGPPITLVAVWLVFLSTARRNMRMFAGAFLHLTAPRLATRVAERRNEANIRRASLPVYGLPPSWSGTRFLGGYGTSGGGRITSLALAHGDPFDEQAPELRVETYVVDVLSAEAIHARNLYEGLLHVARPRPGEISGDEFAEWVRLTDHEIRNAPDPEWTRISVQVDGRSVDFEIVHEGRFWVAWANVDGYVVTLNGRVLKPEDVELVRITNLDPYIEGGKKLREP